MLKMFKNVRSHLENILELSYNDETSRTSDFADENTTIGDNCRRCVFVLVDLISKRCYSHILSKQ